MYRVKPSAPTAHTLIAKRDVMPKKHRKYRTTKSAGAATRRTIRESAVLSAADRDREHEMFDWILNQWLLADASLLSRDKIEMLNARMPGWREHYTNDDAAHALICDNRELQDALESWWNALELPGAPMTYAEIQVKAKLET
jgi:hypothetical protein